MYNSAMQAPTSSHIQFGKFTIEYDNLTSAQQTISGITNFQPRKIIPRSDIPFIIDAGSNIGITTLFFKSIYPQAKLLCFEPDPHAFKILQKNILNNKILDTTLLECALSNTNGEIDFFWPNFC